MKMTTIRNLLVLISACAVLAVSASAVKVTGPPAAQVTLTDLGTLGGLQSGARAINNSGEVVGSAGLTGFEPTRAFLWTSKDGMRDLGTLGGSSDSGALAINNSGEVVGYVLTQDAGEVEFRAFLWTAKDGMRDLGNLGGLGVTIASGINSRGEVVGQSLTSSGQLHAFLWTAKNGMRDLGTLGGTDGQMGGQSGAVSVSERGEIVGQSTIPTGHSHAALWSIKR